jgi:hypothetical protein
MGAGCAVELAVPVRASSGVWQGPFESGAKTESHHDVEQGAVAAVELLVERAVEFLSGVPSSFLSGVPSSFLSGVPSSFLSGVPSSFLSSIPSSFLSSIPSKLSLNSR